MPLSSPHAEVKSNIFWDDDPHPGSLHSPLGDQVSLKILSPILTWENSLLLLEKEVRGDGGVDWVGEGGQHR